MAWPAFKGGDRLRSWFSRLRVGGAGPQAQTATGIRVGFLENATYPDGKSVASIAAIQEYGATVQRDAGTVTIYRRVDKSGTYLLRKGRFVKKTQANFSSTHPHGAYTITIPPRPFFRNALRQYGPHWGDDLATLLRANKLDAERSLTLMGERIKGQIQQSIKDLTSPPLAKSTIARKGFDKPLIDTGHMQNSVDYEVIKK